MISDIKKLLIFSFPIIIAQVGQMLMGIGDNWVAGGESVNLLASVSIVNSFFTPILCFGIGMMLAVSPMLSKLRGQGQSIDDHWPVAVFMGLVTGIILGIANVFVALSIQWWPVDEVLKNNIQSYLLYLSPSYIPVLIFIGLKEYWQARENTSKALAAVLIAAVINVALCLIFVRYFHWSVFGLAFATFIARFLMLIFVLPPKLKIFPSWHQSQKLIAEFLRLGFPQAFAFLGEVGAFSLTTFLVGTMGMYQVAAHQIVLSYASLTFMVPLGVSSALASQVGFCFGEKNWVGARALARAGIVVALIFMGTTASIFIFGSEFLIRIFSHDPQIIEWGKKIFYIAGVFQLADGLQVSLGGILRGFQRTKPVFFANLIGYWAIAIPVGCYFAFYLHKGLPAMWWSLASGLLLVALILLREYKKIIVQNL